MIDFSVISAVALNGVIGDSTTNTMPWHLPTDLKHFKSVTDNKTVVMGSRTHKSIGRVLPNRRNIVITRKPEDARRLLESGVDGCYPALRDVLAGERDGFMVIGGEHIYGDALRLIPTRLYITVVKADADGDVRFPIAGRRFLDDSFIHGTSRYSCDRRSGWLKENGLEFMFTEFKFVPNGSY